MRYTLLISMIVLLFTACKKDKFTTAPQIVFKSFNPTEASNLTPKANQPVVVIEVTDAEGDLGKIGTDISKIYIKNMLTGKEDSLDFPNIQSIAKANFKATVEAGLFNVMGGRNLPFSQRPYSDNLQFEVYVKDFAKHKSNVILTDKPFTYYTLP